MAAEFPLTLLIRAVDQVTAPLRAINERMRAVTAPVRKLNNSFRAFAQEAGLPKLVHRFKGVGESVMHVGHAFEGVIKRALMMEVVGGLAFYELMKSSVEAGAELKKMSERVGMTADQYAGLQYAANQADVTQEEFNGAMNYFNKSLGQAKAGGGQMLGFLQKVSPSLALQVKNATSTSEALRLVGTAMAKVKDPAKRAALSVAFFGRSGQQMGMFFAQGNEEIDKTVKRFGDLAGGQGEFTENAEGMEKALKDSAAAFGGLRNAAMGKLFPALTKLTKAVSDFVAKHREAIVAWAERAGKAISDWVDSGGIQRLSDTLGRWADNLGTVIEALGGFKTIAIAVGAFLLGPFLVAMGSAIASVWSLGVALMATPVGWILGAIALVAIGIYEIYKHWEGFKKWYSSWWGQILRLIPLGGILDAVYAIGSAIEWIHDNWNKIVGAIQAAWEKLKPIIAAIADVFSGAAGGGAAPGQATIAGQPIDMSGGRTLLPSGYLSPVATRQTNDARVTIDIPNLPPGARVSTDPASTAPVSLDLGYSNMGG